MLNKTYRMIILYGRIVLYTFFSLSYLHLCIGIIGCRFIWNLAKKVSEVNFQKFLLFIIFKIFRKGSNKAFTAGSKLIQENLETRIIKFVKILFLK